MRRLLFVLVVLNALAACDPLLPNGLGSFDDEAVADVELPLPVRDSSPVQTDSLSYTLRRRGGVLEATALAVYVNRSATGVHFARCTSDSDDPLLSLRRELPPGASPIVGSPRACVAGVPTGRLAPGDSLVVKVWLGSVDSPSAYPPITMTDRTGIFRVLLDLCAEAVADSDECTLLPAGQRQSNLFRLLPPA